MPWILGPLQNSIDFANITRLTQLTKANEVKSVKWSDSHTTSFYLTDFIPEAARHQFEFEFEFEFEMETKFAIGIAIHDGVTRHQHPRGGAMPWD
jgi:hypothetical protein